MKMTNLPSLFSAVLAIGFQPRLSNPGLYNYDSKFQLVERFRYSVCHVEFRLLYVFVPELDLLHH
jgi:hypothetical protein